MTKSITQKIPRAALPLLLMLTMALTASATNFITDVMVIGNNDETQFDNLEHTYETQGWTAIKKDLNAGCGTGSDYIHLLYKTQSSDGSSGFPITDFYIKTGNNPPESLTHDGRTYYLVPYDGSDNFINSKGDLNRGADGDYIHLYYTKDTFSNLYSVTDITFNDTQNGAVGCNGGSTGYDLNNNCGSGTNYIYMHVTTAFPSGTTAPRRNLDDCAGSYKSIRVKGWAYDPDAPWASLDVHVYIYTNANCTNQYGSIQLVHANEPRADVNSANNIVGNHGFNANIPVNDLGNYWVKVWAIDYNGSNNVQIGLTTAVTVTSIVTLTSGSGEVLLQNGDILNGTGGADTQVTIADGATVTFDGVNITNFYNNSNHLWAGITCLGNAVIVLNENTTSTVKGGWQNPGIHLPQNKTLTIQGSGTLNTIGGHYAAGIGSGQSSSCGNITINSGTVTAEGGFQGAGIGSGDKSSCGNITINGGTVTANGGAYASGIGSGDESSSCGNITISGGTVTANGSAYASGIGSGDNNSSCGNITINGGTVTANGGAYASGIGSGDKNSSCGNITISNSVTCVTAEKGEYCNYSIGPGYHENICGTVTIGGVETSFITINPFTTYPYAVSFDANGGTGSMSGMNFMYNFSKNLNNNNFIRTNYVFQGWATSPDGPKVYDNLESVSNLTQTPGDNVTLYAKWNTDPSHLSVSGNEYTIHTTTGWEVFCDLLADNSYNNFTGKTVKLAADIIVSRMAGSSDHSFSGTFNGQGHTLMVNYNTSEQVTAPFRFVTGGTITNLVTAGTITTSAKFASGMIGKTNGSGTVSITNCMSGVTITSNVNGDGTHGGFVGSVTYGTMNITGCRFSGQMLGTNTTSCGGFVGWTESNNNATTTITDCLFAPTTLKINNGYTFSRARNMNSVTITNSYYTETLGTSQGIQAVSNPAVQPTGNPTATYNVSGLALYSNGIQCGTTFYYDLERNFFRDIHYYTGNKGWYLIASPIPDNTLVSNVNNLITSNSAYDLYYFDQTGGDNGAEWKNYKAHHSDATNPFIALANGKGYLYANSATISLVFSGTPYNGDGRVNLSKDDNARLGQWNLIGNPFASAATINKAFYRMNEEGSEIIANTNYVINPMEGIFVAAETNGEVVTFTPQQSKRGEGMDGHENPEERIVIDLSEDNSIIDRTIVRFGEGQTLPKFQIRDNSTKIYIPQYGEDYAIANATDMGEMPVNFKAEHNGTYTISVNPENVGMAYLHLIDNLTGADVDLLAMNGGDAMNRVSTYTFEAKTTDYESRFRLVFSICGDANDDNEAFAFINNGNIIINGEGILQVVDMMGRVILSGDAKHCVSTTGMTAGVYVLRLVNGNDVKTQKIVIE